MKKLLLCALMLTVTLAPFSELQARRMGGGASLGRQSKSIRPPAAPQPAAPNQQQQAAPQNAQNSAHAAASPWKGMLGGALLGLGLGALLSQLGLGNIAGMIGNILTLLLIAGLAFAAFSWFRRKSLPPTPVLAGNAGIAKNYDTPTTSATPSIGAALRHSSTPATQGQEMPDSFESDRAIPIPEDFDQENFLQHAKKNFIRLQAAWDAKDIADIRAFTTPEMFAELRLQLQEDDSSNITDVVNLEAELLGLEIIDNAYVAVVAFSGTISENAQASPAPFTEIWNLSKPLIGDGGWLLAGIQQTLH